MKGKILLAAWDVSLYHVSLCQVNPDYCCDTLSYSSEQSIIAVCYKSFMALALGAQIYMHAWIM